MSIHRNAAGYESEVLRPILPEADPVGWQYSPCNAAHYQAEPDCEYRPEYVNTHDVGAALCRALERDMELRQSQAPRLSLARFYGPQRAPEPIPEPLDDPASTVRPLAAQTAQDMENLCMIVERSLGEQCGEAQVEIEPYLKRIGKACKQIKKMLKGEAAHYPQPVQLRLI